ncbi:hypothetical protein [Paenibacillus polymyxa]|uniref:hypothetical protein n=1 Tax=Paenibacillus polymyxa TaxID=1406 RepID=UPI002023E1FB|nr:hypothetical protein [Paenibacillus polymyxa]URJ42247.1 hypothetical protein MF627_001906 [Paenibacillus polymyxa]
MVKEAELAVKDRLIDLAMSKLSCVQKKVIHRANWTMRVNLITSVVGRWGLARVPSAGLRLKQSEYLRLL